MMKVNKKTVLCILLALCVVALSAGPSYPAKKENTAKKEDPAKKENYLRKFNEAMIDVAKKNLTMVVNISAVKVAPRSEIQLDLFGGPLRKSPVPMRPEALGSGVIIDKRGYIVTNNHVVDKAKSIKVTLSDRREFQCVIVGTDPATDLAVIKISGKVPDNLPVADLADSDKIQVGEFVIAIGNPFGFSHTVTMGIISAMGRQGVGLADYEYFIQTDAAINPGNSGGGLINMDGKLIGINTAIFSRSGGYMGIGFAIPSNMIRQVVDELIRKGKVTRGWLGVYIQDVTKDIAESFKFGSEKGALVTDIMKGSPADGTGLRTGDIIVAVDGLEIRDVNHLRSLIAAQKPGSAVKLDVMRDGKKSQVEVKIGILPDKPVVVDAGDTQKEDLLGMVVADIDEGIAQRFQVTDKNGVVIIKLAPNAPTLASGLMVGDVIKEIERKPIDNVKAYRDVVDTLKDKKKILFLIKRAGANKFIVVDMGQK